MLTDRSFRTNIASKPSDVVSGVASRVVPNVGANVVPNFDFSRMILVGNPGEIHVGAHLRQAAVGHGMKLDFLNSEEAFTGGVLVRRWNWWMRGHRPANLREFSDRVLEACRRFRPKWLLSTGFAPVDKQSLRAIGKLGVIRLNYLTDDPWNRAHRAPWFMRALPHYDGVFSPRTANLDDLRRVGCANVSYAPFAYEPSIHFPDPPATPAEHQEFTSDVMFAGGADRERIPLILALLRSGYRVALYGGYWDRWPETRPHWRGHAAPGTLRKAVGGAKIALCLVRRSNRDGSCMRTFELAAMHGCMLTEDTDEHRSLLGPDGEATVYFQSIPGMLARVRWLLDNEKERQRLRAAVRDRILHGRHTYSDRLANMLHLSAGLLSDSAIGGAL